MSRKTTTKSRIVDAAWQLFHEKGYEETTIEDIVALSGTSKGTFYHYFEGKDSLLSSLSDLFDSYYEKAAPQLREEENSVDKLIDLSCRVHAIIGERIQPDLLASLYASQVVTHGDKHLLNENRTYYRLIRQIAEEGLRRGEIRADLTVSEVVRLYALSERAIIYDYCISDASYDLGEYTKQVIPLLLTGLRAD